MILSVRAVRYQVSGVRKECQVLKYVYSKEQESIVPLGGYWNNYRRDIPVMAKVDLSRSC